MRQPNRVSNVFSNTFAALSPWGRVVVILLFSITAVMVLSVSAALAQSSNALMLTPMQEPHNAEGKENDTSSTEPPAPIAAPVLATEIEIDIAGPVARTAVRQLFVNQADAWLEGTYVFPLPETAAVDTLRMLVGDRVIEGVVKEKEQARKTFEAARKQGKRASLVTQERPNIFTTHVTNIAPLSTIAVEIGFQETLRWENGHYELRFPTVVGPRYIPGQNPVIGVGGSGVGINTDEVPDAERITPPLHASSADAPINPPANPVVFDVTLDVGVAVSGIESPSHAIEVTELEDGRTRVRIQGGAVPADRDFVLHFAPQAGLKTAVNLFRETDQAGQTYLLALIQPPDPETARASAQARDVVFIVDTSGSMDGLSIKGARAALLKALDGLRPTDRFNIVRFSESASSLFDQVQAATPQAVSRARAYTQNLEADGGTEILSALKLALDGRYQASRVRQVVLLTDGSVGNEAQIISYIRRMRGDARIFTIGIGSAPNTFLMNKAARMGRGAFTYISTPDEAESKIAALYRKLEAPVLSDLRAQFPVQARAEAWPKTMADLYAGEPLMLSARVQSLDGVVTFGGMRGARDWQVDAALSDARPAKGIAKLWARRKIEALMERTYMGVDAEDVRLDVLDVALTHQLVSTYTSLVAVDATPARTGDETLHQTALPTNLPHGWTLKGLFGSVAKTAPGELLRREQDAMRAGSTQGVALLRAKGATMAELQLILGALSIIAGLGVLVLARRYGRGPVA